MMSQFKKHTVSRGRISVGQGRLTFKKNTHSESIGVFSSTSILRLRVDEENVPASTKPVCRLPSLFRYAYLTILSNRSLLTFFLEHRLNRREGE